MLKLPIFCPFAQIQLPAFVKHLLCLLIGIVLFSGGIAILALKIGAWGFLLGLPSIQIGLVILIFTFDEITRLWVGIPSLKQVFCDHCGRPFLVPIGSQKTLCQKCLKKSRQKTSFSKKPSLPILQNKKSKIPTNKFF